MTAPTLGTKFVNDLALIYDGERRFYEAQRSLLGFAGSADLQAMIEEHIDQTEQQMRNLEQIFVIMGNSMISVHNYVAAALAQESSQMLAMAQGNPALIDCIIADSIARVEHYEMASYRSLLDHARQTGQQPIIDLIQQNLHQEEQTATRIEQARPLLLELALQSQEQTA